MKKFALLMIIMGILIAGISIPMAIAGSVESSSHVISIIDIAVGIVMIVFGAAFLAGRK